MSDNQDGSLCRCARPVGWNVWHSLWTVPAVAGIGMVSWVSFGYLAARTHRLLHMLLAIGFAVGAIIAGVVMEQEPPGVNYSGGLWVALWAAGSLGVLIINPAYLRMRWQQTGRCTCSPEHAGPMRRPAAPASGEPPMFVIQDHVAGDSADRGASARFSGASAGAPAATPGWSVVNSYVYTRQKSMVAATVNHTVDDILVADVIDALVMAPGNRLDNEALGVRLAVEPGGFDTAMAALVRQLNVDGYGILDRDRTGASLDVPLLRERYQV